MFLPVNFFERAIRIVKLEILREELNWEMEEKRHEFIRQLERWISDWKGQPPNLLTIFRPEQIECLLSDCIKNILEGSSPYRAFVEFVVRSGYEDVSQVDQDGKPQLRRTTPIHHAAKSSIDLTAVVRELFHVYKCDANYIDETGLTHFHVAVLFGCDDVVEKFLELGQDPNLLVTKTGDSLLHLAAIFGRRKIAEMLVRRGAKTTLFNAEELTPVDIVCKDPRDDVDMANLMFELGHEQYPLWLIHGALKSAISNGLVNLTKALLIRCADTKFESNLFKDHYVRYDLFSICTSVHAFKKFHDINLPEIVSQMIAVQQRCLLHTALRDGNRELVESLLRRGANPNSYSPRGETAVHVVCKREDGDDLVEAFFKICDEIGQTVCVDAQDNRGDTAFYEAARLGRNKTAELLLSRGADPNLADNNGLTLLHAICIHSGPIQYSKTLFEIDERTQRPRVRVDARNNVGNTPLHLALRHGNRRMMKLMLTIGADPNLTDAEGSTALHLVCKDLFAKQDGELVKLFFEICDDKRQFVQIDARDNFGWTPLQWAVASIKPIVVAVLLDRGAEMSRFVFPTLDENDRAFYGARYNPAINYYSEVKLRMASGALLTIEILENAGYELEPSDALTVMKFFARHGLFEVPVDRENRWYDDEKVVKATKEHTISHNFSLYDLIRTRPEQVDTLLIFEAGVTPRKFYRPHPNSYGLPCALHLCEKMSRRFFRNWAIVSFMDLINYRLPLECCETIIDKSFVNRELYNICSAAAIQSS